MNDWNTSNYQREDENINVMFTQRSGDWQSDSYMGEHKNYRCKSKTAAMCTIRREIEGKGTVRENLQLALYKVK